MGAGPWAASRQVLWLVLPIVIAAVGHMLVVRLRILESLAFPLDGYHTWRGARVWGDNKTWRGVLVMACLSALTAGVQGWLLGAWAADRGLSVVDYAALTGSSSRWAVGVGHLMVGGLLGLGYVLGELPNSFVKRRLGVLPGRSAPPPLGVLLFLIDRIDSVAVGLGLLAVVTRLAPRVLLTGMVLLPALHLAVGLALYLARIKRAL